MILKFKVKDHWRILLNDLKKKRIMEKIYKKLCTKINLYEVTNLPYVLWNEFLPWERSNRQEFLRLFPLGKSRGA